MGYMGDKAYWDEKFCNRSDNILKPEKLLADNIDYFKKGTVLDMACGDGRNALFLLEKGFRVTGVDFSTEALKRLNIFAERKKYLINTIQMDLSKQDLLNNIGIFDNIIINHYRLSKDKFRDIKNHISDKGIIFICGFGHKHKVDAKIRKQDLIQPSDFQYLEKSFELVKYIENEDERGFFVTYIFRKKSS